MFHQKYFLGLIILLIVAYIIYYFTIRIKFLEKFNVSPSNSYNINENILDIHKKINISRDIYSSALQKKFENINKIMEINNKIYAQDFILRNLLENFTKEELNKLFPDSPIEVSEIENIGWDEKIKPDSVIFNFDINLINRNVRWIIPIKVWIQLNTKILCEKSIGCVETISQFIRENIISNNEIIKNFKLLDITIENIKKYEIKPMDLSNPDYYQIKNKLYLTEPFLTSREEIRLKNINK